MLSPRAPWRRAASLLVCAAATCGVAASIQNPPAASRQVLTRHFGPEDRGAGRYQYIPFDVPPDTSRLDIRYRYDRAGGTNVIDLGLFEPGPLDLGTTAFRGWSGSERTAISFTASTATPGYRPGPLPAGRWHLMLGLYRVAQGGVDVNITIEVRQGPATAAAVPRPAPTAALRPASGWYRGDLHLHTVHSDGALTLAKLTTRARQAGLDFIAVTDHNNTTHQFDAAGEDRIVRLVGEEVTTPGGHANVWGLSPGDWIDFRVRPQERRIGALVAAATARGALFSINHPSASCLDCSWTHEIPSGVAAIEIWNRADGPQAEAIALWDRLLGEGRQLTAVGSSDWHRDPVPLGAASVAVFAQELSAPAVLDAIRHHRVVVMRDPRAPVPAFWVGNAAGTVKATVGESLRDRAGAMLAIEVAVPGVDDGRVELYWRGELAMTKPLVSAVPARFPWTLSADGYLRAHVVGRDGSVVAVTNPVFVEVAR